MRASPHDETTLLKTANSINEGVTKCKILYFGGNEIEWKRQKECRLRAGFLVDGSGMNTVRGANDNDGK